jgi:outer membrane lipoprotein-sorting protein
MRHCIRGLSAGILVLAVGVAGWGGQADEAKELVAKAIKACGGEAKVAPLKAATCKAKANIQDGNMQVSATIDAAWQGIDQHRFTVAAEFGGMTKNMVIVINGDKGWARDADNNTTKPAPAEAPPLINAVLFAMRMPHLLPSLLDKEVKLSPAGEVQVDGRAAVGVTVSRTDRKDVRLYFDKENGVPVKSEVRVTDPNGKETDFEFLFREYKDQAGLKHPTRLHIKGPEKADIVVEISELMAQAKLEPALFAAPE